MCHNIAIKDAFIYFTEGFIIMERKFLVQGAMVSKGEITKLLVASLCSMMAVERLSKYPGLEDIWDSLDLKFCGKKKSRYMKNMWAVLTIRG